MLSQLGLDLLQSAAESAPMEVFSSTVEGADAVYVKKLSLNDWQWTEDPDKHQGGPYIPRRDRDSGFFPKLARRPGRKGKPPIYEAYFEVDWVETGKRQPARLVHYTSKDQETHLTNLPRGPFAGLSPASYLVIARRSSSKTGVPEYQAITVDSASDECASLIDLFEIDPGFRSGQFSPTRVIQKRQDSILQFIDEALAAFKAGNLESFSDSLTAAPSTKDFARQAQAEYMQEHPGLLDLNPYHLSKPGDVLLEISRSIEHALYRAYELRRRSLELVSLILGPDPNSATAESVFRSIILGFPRIDKVLLSAAQQRRSRAGYSFEHHIGRMLLDGRIPHQAQVVIGSKKRPDFVLPTLAYYQDRTRAKRGALVLSAKTTLRERWKQITGEIKNCDLYLATVDERIAANAIQDMKTCGITLVVPESLKQSKITAYQKQPNVIGFREFFDNEIRAKRSRLWAALGISPGTNSGNSTSQASKRNNRRQAYFAGASS